MQRVYLSDLARHSHRVIDALTLVVAVLTFGGYFGEMMPGIWSAVVPGVTGFLVGLRIIWRIGIYRSTSRQHRSLFRELDRLIGSHSDLQALVVPGGSTLFIVHRRGLMRRLDAFRLPREAWGAPPGSRVAVQVDRYGLISGKQDVVRWVDGFSTLTGERTLTLMPSDRAPQSKKDIRRAGQMALRHGFCDVSEIELLCVITELNASRVFVGVTVEPEGERE